MDIETARSTGLSKGGAEYQKKLGIILLEVLGIEFSELIGTLFLVSMGGTSYGASR